MNINNIRYNKLGRLASLGLMISLSLSALNSIEAQNKEKTKKVEPVSAVNKNTQKMDSLSYSLGVLLAQNVKQLGLENIDGASMSQAIMDVIDNKTLAISPDQANYIVSNEINAAAERKAGPAIEEGKKFLAENAKKAGVKTTASGLQYEVIESGNGKTPSINDKVTTHYRGTLINGKQFDSSYDRGQPATFPVSGVIKGWTEALQLMKEGDKWRLYIPYDLAYGERGAGADIAPYSTLIFDIELIKVN